LSFLDDIQAQQSLPISWETDENSQVLDNLESLPPFVAEASDIAILMGNEGQGIHPKHLEAFQGRLIRILVPQYGVGTASFNVNVACSIVLYHIHKWKYRRELLLIIWTSYRPKQRALKEVFTRDPGNLAVPAESL
jgi:tRNA(Leu) C34 or U34 (ribose-2'-O)-methylase TrmL